MARELTRTTVLGIAEENEVVDALRSHGLDEVAARLAHVGAMLSDDLDGPDLVIESLRSFADFFMQQHRLPVPEIGVGPQGYLEAEWRLPANGGAMVASDERYWGRGDGILAMKFLPTGLVQFAATSGPAGQGKERLTTRGILPENRVMSAVQTFVSRLAVA